MPDLPGVNRYLYCNLSVEREKGLGGVGGGCGADAKESRVRDEIGLGCRGVDEDGTARTCEVQTTSSKVSSDVHAKRG